MLFKRSSTTDVERVVTDILDALNCLVMVVRGPGCETLYLNAIAQDFLIREQQSFASCRNGCAALFSNLCEKCANRNGDSSDFSERFELSDKSGHAYAVTTRGITWSDGKPATLLMLEDIQDRKDIERRLYNFAYLDQLTMTPNRLKLKEDFEKIQKMGGYVGAIAMLDMDNFKAVNDTYGHNTGDVMIRRLVDHLNQFPAFAGHLYRLGGDEFVLFYAQKEGRLKGEADFRQYYGGILREAFQSYSMPHINLICTISMGVAFFPLHGTLLSELLRKADIALYQAKDAGRNRLVFFEDKYDTAKKFEDYYICIRPILTAGGKTFGYELTENIPQDSDNWSLGDYDRAVDSLGLRELENHFKYVINHSNKLNCKPVLNHLPKDKFIVQMRFSKTVSEEELEACRRLHACGYSLLIDGLQQNEWTKELLQIGDYFKFAPDVPEEVQFRIIFKTPDKTFIATEVNSQEAWERAHKAGFTLFQGNYFSQPPVIRKEKDISPLKANYLRLIKLTSTDDYVDFSKITQVISSDVALSYKLLKLLNSAAVGLRNRMSSIPMAVSYLGEEGLKKWIALLALRGVAGDKPLELIRMSLIRAQFGELLVPHMQPPRDGKYVFLTGMFSLLHIALDMTVEELMEEIPMAEDIRLSLTTDTGPYSDLIAFFNHYEYANWDEVTKFSEANRLNSDIIYNCYIAAINWYNEVAGI